MANTPDSNIHASSEPQLLDTPLDKALAQMNQMLAGLETAKAESQKAVEIPDDIPRFTTREW